MKENDSFKVSKSKYKIIKKYITAFEKAQPKSLYDVYRKPSFFKKTAFSQHKYIAHTLYTFENELPFEECYETRITSYNQYMFTCVTKLEFNNRPYSIYIISLPSVTYIYFTTQEVIEIVNTTDIDLAIMYARKISMSYPNTEQQN